MNEKYVICTFAFFFFLMRQLGEVWHTENYIMLVIVMCEEIGENPLVGIDGNTAHMQSL